MRLAPRMALQFAAGLALLAVVLLVAAPAVAQRVMTGSLGPVLLRQARGVAALLEGQAGARRPPGGRLADLAAIRLARLYVDGEVLVVDGRGVIRWNSGTIMGDLRGWRVHPPWWPARARRATGCTRWWKVCGQWWRWRHWPSRRGRTHPGPWSSSVPCGNWEGYTVPS
ncbi:MAG TPA: hypothetical protein VIK92_02755 [Thermaerobacter sp.]